jgi:hypothetical protein
MMVKTILLASLLTVCGASVALAQAPQSNVATPGALPKTDAEPGYWTNLFANTMRFNVMHPAGKQMVDVFYNRDKTVTTDVGLKGVWSTEGEPGKEMFCYSLGPFKAAPAEISECFPLRLMNNPRIGAKWGGKMKPNVNYLAEVVAGRPNDPAQKK